MRIAGSLAGGLYTTEAREITVLWRLRKSRSNIANILPGFTAGAVIGPLVGCKQAGLEYPTSYDQLDRVVAGIEQLDREAAAKSGLDHRIHMNSEPCITAP